MVIPVPNRITKRSQSITYPRTYMSAASLRFNHSSKSTARLPMGDFPATFQVPTKSLEYACRHSYNSEKKEKENWSIGRSIAQARSSQKLTLTHWSKCMELIPGIGSKHHLGSHHFHFLLMEKFSELMKGNMIESH